MANSPVYTFEDLEGSIPVSKDLLSQAALLSRGDARYLVNMYYEVQEQRIRAAAQRRAAGESLDTHNPIVFIGDQFSVFERNVQKALLAYARGDTIGQWALSITGIGPVISAGLMAHIDIERAPTVGHIWSFAGLDPTKQWLKGEKRPWNADLKVLCWKIGESFVKVSNNANDTYGHVYAERKLLETQKNENLEYADQATLSLTTKKYGEDTIARQWYEQGKLPPARIHARAKRYAVKLFLAHWHHVAYEAHYNTLPPRPLLRLIGPSHNRSGR